MSTAAQKSFFGSLLAAIGGFFSHLVSGAKSAFSDLPKEQQDAIIQGVNISQILKDGYTKGVDAVLSEIQSKLNIPVDVATILLQTALKDVGIDEADLEIGFGKLADKIQAGITDNHWNSLWQTVAKSAAQWLSIGKVDWVSLSMGLIEWSFQRFVKAE